MNILALNWQDISNPLAGGAEVHLEELLRRIVSRGHKITLFCSGYDGAPTEEIINGIKIIRRGNRYNFNLVAPFYLRKIVKQNNFDVLIEDINKIPFYTPLYLNLPTLVVIPHLFSTSVFKEINFFLGLYIYISEVPLVTVYRGFKFNVISESTAGDMINKGIPENDVSVIHCGIDSAVYNLDNNIPKFEAPSILYLGRIKKYKSIDDLLFAFERVLRKVPRARLNIVGNGDYLERLRILADRLKIDDKINFTGFVSESEKVEYLRRSHVAVYPSLKEGWGLTNIEANACGTAVVAANSPGLRDSVVDGETGFLYEYGNINELASKLEKVLLEDNIRVKLQDGGINWVKKFNWDDAASQFLDLLKSVANGVR